ncbi:MAG: flagellar hook-basal body complex protein [Balneolales bacterium]
MALMKSLNSGISGLKAFQTKMDVIGNNIANVDTAGFKSSRVSFSEMLNQQVGSAQGSQDSPQSGSSVGLGVRIAAVQRDFAQGGLETTGRPTDLALEGEGFFMVEDGGGQSMLTRAGNFAFNKTGMFTDQAGRPVQGFNADANGNILAGGATENVRVDFESVLDPLITENVYVGGNLNADTSSFQMVQSQTALTTKDGDIADGATELNDLMQTAVDFGAGDVIDFEFMSNDGTGTYNVLHNYDTDGTTVGELINSISGDGTFGNEGSVELVDGMLVLRSNVMGESDFSLTGITVTGTGELTSPGFQVTQPGVTGNQTLSTTVYDSLGREHTMLVTLTQDNENSWSYETTFLDGEAVTGGTGTGTMDFDESGNLITENSFNVEFDPGNGAELVNFDVNLGDPDSGTRMSQFAGATSAKVTSQDGFAEGRLVDFNIDGDGYVNGTYSNGRNVQLAQLAVADVPNTAGLETNGNGLYTETVASGEISLDTAENLSATSIAESVLEASNVDLAKEFTDMITSQRAYQSNARVITTADELLTEAVNLKR